MTVFAEAWVVAKIAPLPFDDRWCAYVQEAAQE